MKVSLNWLRQYIDIDKTPSEIEEILTDIGLEVEGEEVYETITGGLKGLVIGAVKSCEKHPNANKLSVTKVDVGGDRLLDIVCGAPNVAAGQKVVVATVGTTIYPAEGDPIKMKKSKIRGEVSEGMICAEDEIGLGSSHAGIMVLPEDAKVGTAASEYFQIETDTVIEIGLTPNRSDATSHMGVAEDLAARLKIQYGHSGEITRPSVAAFEAKADLPIEVEVENYTACPRYSGIVVKNIQVKPSPDWLKHRLEAIGVRSINNVVDITNFVLHELGQPLHAFDYDKVKGNKVIVKNLAQDTAFTTLDEVERKLQAEDLMICNGESEGMCIAGVFGGMTSGVTEATTTIFLESAYFEPRALRRTSTRHLLRTDAAKCYEKGADPNITIYALQRAVLLLQELAGGEVASEIIDLYPNPIEPVEVVVKYANIRKLIGVEIPTDKILEILDALKMTVSNVTAEGFTVAVPTNKHDVTREADVIEEILRIYGFNQVEFSDRLNSTLAYSDGVTKQYLQETISNVLAGSGFHEMMSLSITQSKYHKEILPIEDQQLVYINNTSNQHLDIMRPTMLFSGLEAIVRNQNRQHSDLKLYEFGKTYLNASTDEAAKFIETAHLAMFITGQQSQENWLEPSKAVSYYTLKSYVDNTLRKLNMDGFQVKPLQNDIWVYGLQYHRGKQILAEFGRVHGGILRKMDIKQEVYFADIQWDSIYKTANKSKIHVQDLPKYPFVRRDLALVLDKAVSFGDVVKIAKKQAKKLLKDVNLFDVYENDEQIGKGKKSCAVSFIFQDEQKTLKDKDIEKLMNKLVKTYEIQLNATIRR